MNRYCACGQKFCGYPDCRHGDFGLSDDEDVDSVPEWRDEAPDPGPTMPNLPVDLLFGMALVSGSFALLVWMLV